jgi:hypothetical protein
VKSSCRCAIRSNCDSTKVCFACFGFYSGAGADKKKAWFLIIRTGKSGQAEIARSRARAKGFTIR